MSESGDRAVYRVHRVHRKGDVPRKYQHSLELTDEHTREVMATCDLIGKAMSSTLAIMDRDQRIWEMKPSSKVTPSCWAVTDPDQRIAMQLDQMAVARLANPLYRVALALLDAEGSELYRLVDPRTDMPDKALGLGPSEWALLKDERPVGKLVRLPRQPDRAAGFLGKMRRHLAGSDQGIVSAGSDHVLAAPVALGMLMIFNELTDPSG